MAHGRWYPTATTLGDGRVMTFSGLGDTGATNSTVEIYNVATGIWSTEYPAGWTPPLYPRMMGMPPPYPRIMKMLASYPPMLEMPMPYQRIIPSSLKM